MNIAVTLSAAAAIALTPVAAPVALSDIAPAALNPLKSASISAGGITVEIGPDGVHATPGASTDFEFKLELTSGTPVRIRL